ncbi:hypothetical protein DIZ47_10590 [Legionella taurinensis]|nr:hypothetical protein [Legionella taurinensis]MDX1838259.1 hypothetical protein [Legionella taurinensis]TID50548.1 hypothetical protein DIZ47_10590 [Legionella taurinensis]
MAVMEAGAPFMDARLRGEEQEGRHRMTLSVDSSAVLPAKAGNHSKPVWGMHGTKQARPRD